MIALEHVSKRYGTQAAVNDLSFTVEQGQLCAILGSSGSGKSTTLRMVNRLIEPSAGTIRIGGEDVAALPLEALRRRIGYAIQSVGLFPHWTIADNIATVPRLLRWPQEKIHIRVEELLSLLQLDSDRVRGQYPHQLSGGQQQRVGVARALAADPDLLLMDEPFGALDPLTRRDLRTELRRIQRATGKTILFVTHDVDEALELADVIAVMRDGRLLQFGRPEQLITQPADDFVRSFMGGPELGLKLLALRRVGERLQREPALGEPAISAEASLSEALSQMVLRGAAALPVQDDKGARAGSINLSDLVKR
jgi:osmoprotectant transport system ATP-binding protein